jgi:hypothetical protein
MIPDLQLKALIVVVLAALAVVLFMQGRPVPVSDFYNAFSYVVTSVAFALLLWERTSGTGGRSIRTCTRNQT